MSPRTYCQENSAQKPGVMRIPIQVSSATRILPGIDISRYSNATPAAHSAADSSSPTKAVRPGNRGRLWANIANTPMPNVETSSQRTAWLANRSSMLLFSLPQAGAVASLILGPIERLVGAHQDLVQRGPVLGIDRYSGREGALHPPLADIDLGGGEIAPPAIDAGQGLIAGGAGQQDQDLLAAGTEDEIALAHPLGQKAPDRLQHAVACLVAVMVVEPLEIIEIGHDHRQLLAVLIGLGRQLTADIVEHAAVMQPGQAVARRLLAQFDLEPGAAGDVAQQQHPPDQAPAMGQRHQGDLEAAIRAEQQLGGRVLSGGR